MNLVFLITNIPNPYRIPLFNEINTILKNNGIRLKVYFAANGYSRRKWHIDLNECHFEYCILSSRKIRSLKKESPIFFYSGICKEIIKNKPDMVIVSSFSVAALKIFLLSTFMPIKFLIWSGSINTKGRTDDIFKRLSRIVLAKKAAGFIAYGSKAKEYLISLGIDPNKIEIAINASDTIYYNSKVKEIREQRLLIEDRCKSILYLGHLTPKKRIDLIFIALKRLIQLGNKVQLVLVGDGPGRKTLELMANELEIEKYVSFEGFKQKNEIPSFLASADCLVFPSEYDIWGLVLVEAMAAGVPCLSSPHAGATHDLIIDGQNGFIVDFEKIDLVVNCLQQLFASFEYASRIGINAANFIAKNVSFKISALGFHKAILKALSNQ